jgi:hypothetical protein
MLRLICALVLIAASAARADAWKIEAIETPGAVLELIEVGGEPRIATASGWFSVVADGEKVRLQNAAPPRYPPIPTDALPDGRIAAGKGGIARTWLAEPTARYGHGVLGDAIEAGALVVERRDGKRDIVRLGKDAVFEDLEPRVADLGDGEKIVVVKSYLAAGAALAVIGERDGRFAILAETPPIGTPNRWLNPAGIADFSGEGAVEIALVRMPHALGRLELWRWSAGKLIKNCRDARHVEPRHRFARAGTERGCRFRRRRRRRSGHSVVQSPRHPPCFVSRRNSRYRPRGACCSGDDGLRANRTWLRRTGGTFRHGGRKAFQAASLIKPAKFFNRLMAGLDPAIQSKWHGRLDARVKPAHEGEFCCSLRFGFQTAAFLPAAEIRPSFDSVSPHLHEGDGAPRGALFAFHACEAWCASCSFRNKSRSPLSAPSRRLKPRAALLLGPLGFRPVALSQPAPGGRPVRPTSGAPRLPVPCLRGTAAGAASCTANQTPLAAR